MKGMVYTIGAKVWRHQGDSPWHFITIKKSDADEIKKQYIWLRRGFGSIPVNVRIGKAQWKTSIFPDKEGTYVLPLKKDVRIQEMVKAGDNITVNLEVRL